MKKIMSIIVCLMMCFSTISVYGLEETDTNDNQTTENTTTQESSNEQVDLSEEKSKEQADDTPVISTCDENGDIQYGQFEDGTVEEISTYARASAFSDSSLLVNFNYNLSSGTTTSYQMTLSGKNGYTYGASNADAAYLGTTSSGKVKFMMSGVIGEVDASKVQVVSALKYYESYYINKSGTFYHYICQNVNNNPSLSNYLGTSPSYLSSGEKYYSYDGHYFYSNYDEMISDYKAGNRNHSVNASNPYYNYFEYLSLRSKTSYTADQLNSFITYKKGASTNSKLKNMGASFINYQNKYGINALLALAVACNESAYGTSSIAQSKNNLFGLQVYDSSTGSGTSYNSVDACIKDFMGHYMSTGYLDSSDWRYNGSMTGNKGSGANVAYASGAFWGETAASIALSIDNYLGKKDYQKYTTAVSDTLPSGASNVAITSSAGGGSTLYRQGSIPNYPILILGSVGNYYKIQTDSVLASSGTSIDTSKEDYNFNTCVGYVPKSTFTTISSGGATNEVIAPSLTCQGYSENSSWLSTVSAGVTCGTTGQAKKLQAFKINFSGGSYSGGISYSAHVSNVGWQSAQSSGGVAGTAGSNQIEAIKMNLTGSIESSYDIYYRAHVSNIGWMGWTKNGSIAGTTGYAFPVEAIQVVLVNKGGSAPGDTTNPYYSPSLSYSTHVQDIGWQGAVSDGALAGTTGQSKRVEALKISVPNSYYSGSIVYKTHVSNIGWQSEVSDGAIAGTTGQSQQVEALTIRLTGELANHYDVYYRVHAQNFGWMSWTKNGEQSGSQGYGYRVEAVETQLVKKGQSGPATSGSAFKIANLKCQAHVQDIGWQDYKFDGDTIGTVGQGKRLEAIKIYAMNLPYSGSISYRTHIQNIGWQGWCGNNVMSGTSGRSLRLEAIELKLTGTIANYYDIYYRTHAQNFGWLAWTKNGDSAGTQGYSYRLEAIEIKLVKKGDTAPSTTGSAFKKK